MDYCEWVENRRGKTPVVTDWETIPAEEIADPMVSTHTGTVRKTWVGDKVVLTRVVVRPNSRGKPHSHGAEQVSMILRGAVRLRIGDAERIAQCYDEDTRHWLAALADQYDPAGVLRVGQVVRRSR